MNRRNFINALLVFALCYGQIVASVHVVGHMQHHDCELQDRSFSDVCVVSHHSFVTNAWPTAHHDATHDATLSEAGGHVENDCAIYHALLSLNGVFDAVKDTSYVRLPSQAGNPLPISHIANVASKQQQIRAPPAVV